MSLSVANRTSAFLNLYDVIVRSEMTAQGSQAGKNRFAVRCSPFQTGTAKIVPKSAMRSVPVVIRPPRFDFAPRVRDRQELVCVQTLIAQFAVE